MFKSMYKAQLKRQGIAALLLIVSLMLAACDSGNSASTNNGAANNAANNAGQAASGAPSDNTRRFVGQVQDSDAFIGLVASGGKLMTYVCDGSNSQVNISEWFSNTISGSNFSLTSADGAQLNGTLGDQASGTLTMTDGRKFSFNAAAASGQIGLYRATQTISDTSYTGGWILLTDGQQRGNVKQCRPRGCADIVALLDPNTRTVTIPDGNGGTVQIIAILIG